MQHRATPGATLIGCVVTLIALFVFCVAVGAGLAIGWGLVS